MSITAKQFSERLGEKHERKVRENVEDCFKKGWLRVLPLFELEQAEKADSFHPRDDGYEDLVWELYHAEDKETRDHWYFMAEMLGTAVAKDYVAHLHNQPMTSVSSWFRLADRMLSRLLERFSQKDQGAA